MQLYKYYVEAKSQVKRLLPKQLLGIVRTIVHWTESWLAQLVNGFPARSMHFVGITGTNGKTTTSLLLAEILNESGLKVGVSTTAVNGVVGELEYNDFELTTANPFMIQKLLRKLKNNGCDWIVMEVASHALVQRRVAGIKFDVTVFTNLEHDHLDYHGTMQRYAAAKGLLFKNHPKLSVLNLDSEWFNFFAGFKADELVTFGLSTKADSRIVKANLSAKKTKLTLKLGENQIKVDFSLPGKFNSMNALAAAATAHGMEINVDDIKNGLEKVESIPGRMEIIDEGQNFVVIVDYAHTADALDTVFETINQTNKGRLISILGIGGDRDKAKRYPMGQTTAKHADVVIVTDLEPRSEDPVAIRHALRDGAESEGKAKVEEIADRTKAIKHAFKIAKKHDTVVMTALGHQKHRQMGAEEFIEWDEREVARKLLRELLKKSSD